MKVGAAGAARLRSGSCARSSATLPGRRAGDGHATHYSVKLAGRELADIAWSYDDPLDDAVPVRGLICFYQERLQLFVDGQPVEQIRTPWS